MNLGSSPYPSPNIAKFWLPYQVICYTLTVDLVS